MREAGSAFEGPIRIEYRPSPRVLALQVVMYLGAIVAVALSGIPDWARLATATLVIAILVHRSRRWWREFFDPAPPILQLNARDEWRLQHAGRNGRLTLGTETVSLPGLIVLHLRDEARSDRYFLLAPDNAPRDVLRRLRVRLRFPIARPD